MPNLFEFATSELSQDAILCWLAAWADPSSAEHDQTLHRLGQAFLRAIFEKHNREFPEILTPIKIMRQHRSIDVLVAINDSIAVCIEDKVGSTEHSNQLQRYIKNLEKDGYSNDQIIPVYVQTGDQSNYRRVTAAGYGVIRRSELIGLLRGYLDQGGSDSIAVDFYDYLVGIETRLAAFRTCPITDWDWYAWQGFYMEIQNVLDDGDWGYVAQRSGGFLGYWWHWNSDEDSEQYLQIEQGKLCFKISVGETARRPGLRSNWHARILEAGNNQNFPVVRPRRFGSGQTMTVALYDGEFRIHDSQGCIDIDATINVLRQAAKVLDEAVAVDSN